MVTIPTRVNLTDLSLREAATMTMITRVAGQKATKRLLTMIMTNIIAGSRR